MIHKLLRYCALVGAVGLGACDLNVINPNSPETERVLASPEDLENLLGSYYKRWHDGPYRGFGVVGMANVQSFENYSSLANNGQNARSGIPRPPNDNSIGNPNQGDQSRIFFIHSEVNRVATNILKTLNSPGYSLGGTAARDLKAKSFAEFLRGVSLGYLALIYDSAAIVHEGLAGDAGGDFSHYSVVMDSAIVALQRSIDFATQSAAVTGATDGFPVNNWIPTTDNMSASYFIRVVRSYRARLRAGVARTPAERADISAGGLVDWDEVILDAQNGITKDHDNITNATTGPFKAWVAQMHNRGNWHQMTPFIAGMADVSGSYAAWIATPLAQRGAGGIFFMVTPDLRFPQGSTRPLQQADYVLQTCEQPARPCKRYFLNRPNADDNQSGDAWGISAYDNLRWWSWHKQGDAGSPNNGAIVFITKVENDMLEAEGHFRKPGGPDYASMATLINLSRTRGMICRNCPVGVGATPDSVATGGGLPAVTATASGGLVMPDCVPKRPTNANAAGAGTVACGDIYEAMKWEKRIETHFTHYAGWLIDHRGWGDLVEGTPLHWAPPWQDLQVRSKPIYSTGTGTSGGAAAGPSTYGW